MSPTPADIIIDYLRKEMVSIAPDKYYHDCPDYGDDDFPEPVGYEPSRNAIEWTDTAFGVLNNFYATANALDCMRPGVLLDLKQELQKAFDRWDHDR
jgi:hypothetical protein